MVVKGAPGLRQSLGKRDKADLDMSLRKYDYSSGAGPAPRGRDFSVYRPEGGWELQQDADTPLAPPTTTAPLPPPPPTTAGPASQAPLFEWYTYRAVPKDAYSKYGFGNTNSANPDGVMWYLTNEVVTQYGGPPRCERKFNISKIMRFKVRSKATAEMSAIDMNFGTRFAYDFGRCTGRCFSGNLCTSPRDCDEKYERYGFVPGCNNFWDHSVFPDFTVDAAPNGVWYTFPLAGKCDNPTGAHDCTWTVEMAGEVTLRELEETRPAAGDGSQGGNCCDGRCSYFWDNIGDASFTGQRSWALLDKFQNKYPDMPALNTPACDFDAYKWYSPDAWNRTDPWLTKGFWERSEEAILADAWPGEIS